MHRIGTPAVVAVLLVASGCALFPIDPLPMPPAREDVPPQAFERAFLAEDGRSVRVEFTGSAPFDPGNPCTEEYRGTAEADGDELLILVFPQPHPMELGEGMDCAGMGFGRALEIELEEPFVGERARDVNGNVSFLGPPAGLASIEGLPDGWELRDDRTAISESTTPIWQRTWSPAESPTTESGDPVVGLSQAFGARLFNRPEGAPDAFVQIGPSRADVWASDQSSEIIIAWFDGTDDYQLAFYGTTLDQALAIAASVRFGR